MDEYTGKAGRKPMLDSQKAESKIASLPALKAGSFLPLPPDGMPGEAQQEWRRVGEYLLLTDRVAKLDAQSLGFYAASYAFFSQATRQLLVGRSPLWGEVRGRPKPNKLIGLLLQHGAIVIKMSRRFGMTARTRHLDHSKSSRPATPEQIRLRRGMEPIRGNRKRAKLALEWDAESVARPDWLNRDAAAEWDRITEQLDVLELWTPLDVGPVAVLCGAYSLAAKCASGLAGSPLTLPIDGAEGLVEHPLSEIYRDLFSLCDSVWQDYGMTPYDRQQFHHVEGEQQGKPKLAVFPGEVV